MQAAIGSHNLSFRSAKCTPVLVQSLAHTSVRHDAFSTGYMERLAQHWLTELLGHQWFGHINLFAACNSHCGFHHNLS